MTKIHLKFLRRQILILKFDIAFIGDSFTEGVSLEYKNTFVGQISNYLSNYKIANLGVVSYSPIYFQNCNTSSIKAINLIEVIFILYK